MSKRTKALFCVETAALLAAEAWILVLLFPTELPVSPYQSINTNPDLTLRAARPFSLIFGQTMDFLYSNSGGDTYTYGNYYKLEAKRGGSWRELPNKGEAYEDIGHSIGPYGQPRPRANAFEGPFSLSVDWSRSYGALPSGEYRLIQEVQNESTGRYYLVAAEFEIPDTEG